ncbi:TPA: hypothetical protein DIC20_02315 [Candidatus Dependentiae bacterium]|nr:MAG: hypothetical protein US03_C0003G0022 [candidate division TM6 bacterium GW2011_GWF2_36_131]KKQ03341.1 MAG: hypothetical protein US13_C0003G0022 [candidate division TM6 bacterium GW2011_GWE2_36_25]KKQ19737.1 MAG: hypothetical protein US32_C0005G0021 [candidate division TM6 bacterium GW2011_GWA2_36_9]HBR70881.1 hypothetical protein [Candidatus Dependentiae bacterium]HCU00516.1 hypothetical protein [Candidatus Dependentiae bacterium]
MKKIFIACTLLSFLNTNPQQEASHYTINMFIKEYPDEEQQKNIARISPQFLPKQLMRSTFYQPVNGGIYGLYNGYLSHSNEFGLLSFPRKAQREQFMLVITHQLKPTFLLDNTINQWQIVDPEQTAMFQVKKYKDPETKIRYWKVLKVNLPKNNYIPIHSIVIIAKPKNIYVPLGVTPTTKFPNLVLPSIYAKRGLDRITNALFILNIKQFFAPVKILTKTDRLSQDKILTA